MPLWIRKLLSVVAVVSFLGSAFGQDSRQDDSADLSGLVDYLTKMIETDDPDWLIPDEPIRVTIAVWANDAKTDKMVERPAITTAWLWRGQGRVTTLLHRKTELGWSETPTQVLVDKAISGDAAWSRHRDEITIDSTGGSLAGTATRAFDEVRLHLRWLLRQGVYGFEAYDWEFDSAHGDAAGWSAQWTLSEPLGAMRLEGQGILPDDIMVERVSFKEGAPNAGHEWVLANTLNGHRQLPWGTGIVAGSYTVLDQRDGIELTRIEIKEIEYITEDEFNKAIEAPDPFSPPDGIDAVTDRSGLREHTWARQDDEMVQGASPWQINRLALIAAVGVACIAGIAGAVALLRRLQDR